MLTVDNVMKSYTGKVGCMCGCQGNYRVASRFFEAACKDRGYDYDRSEISDRAVKMAVNRLNKLIDWEDPEAVAKHVNEDHAWFETDNGRTVVVYFAP